MIAKARRALFGDDFNLYYELLKNQLIFLDGDKDDFYFLEHYVLLGNYARDPDRFEAMDEMFQQFLARSRRKHSAGRTPGRKCRKVSRSLFADVDKLKREIGVLEEQRENLAKRLENGGGLFNKFLSNAPDPMRLHAPRLTAVEKRLKGSESASWRSSGLSSTRHASKWILSARIIRENLAII